jgi:DNA-binding LacI/PurR family transcriptional regulator
MNILRSDGIKFRELAKAIRNKIDSGKLMPGDLIPSEPSLQKSYNVSRMTVRNAVNLLVSDDLLKKERGRGKGTVVLKKDEESSKRRKGQSFGVLTGARNLYSDRSDMPSIINGIINRLNMWEANLNIFPFLPEIDQFEHLKNIINRNVIDGLFLWSMTPYTENIIKYLKEKNFPFIFIAPSETNSLFENGNPFLGVDELKTVNSLLSGTKGKFHKLIFLGVKGIETSRTYNLFGRSAEAENFSFEKHLLSSNSNAFLEIIEFLNSGQLEGKLIIVSSHGILPYFNAAVSHLKLEVPGDISVIYFKHFSPDHETSANEYSSIERNFIELGEKAAEMMEEIMEMKIKGKDIYSIPSFKIQSILKNKGSIKK